MATKTRRRTRVPRAFTRAFRKTRKKNNVRIPLGLVAGVMPLAMTVWDRSSSKVGYRDKIKEFAYVLVQKTTGFRIFGTTPGGWSFADMKEGLFPILAGLLAHKVAQKVGVNRMIRRFKIPWVEI